MVPSAAIATATRQYKGKRNVPHVHADGMAIHHKLAILGLNVALELAVGGVVLEHVDLQAEQKREREGWRIPCS